MDFFMDFLWVVPMKTHSFMGHENFLGFPWVFYGSVSGRLSDGMNYRISMPA